jgi:hypothetical protein
MHVVELHSFAVMEHIAVLLMDLGQNHAFAPLLTS